MYDSYFLKHRRSLQDNSIQLKSRHLIMTNQIKKKEENWNNRFYVQKSIINYQVEQSEPTIKEYYAKLIEVQDYHNIPEFHRQLFLMCLQTLPKKEYVIKFEIEEIQLKKSHIQECMQAIENREKCLNFLLNNIQLIQDNPQDEQLIFKSSELIIHLRILSVNVVESIISWRQYLMKFLVNIHTLESISLPYIYFNENYLIKMKKDALHIQNSVLSNFYSFENPSDPFFATVTKDPNKIVQFISKPLLKRIENIKHLIEDEISQFQKENNSLQKQISQKDKVKINPRKTLEINRLKSSKRPNISQNRNRATIKQHDIIDFKTNPNTGSNPQIFPQQQFNKSNINIQQKKNLIAILNNKNQNNRNKSSQKQLQKSNIQSFQNRQKINRKIHSLTYSDEIEFQNDHLIKIQKCYLSDKLVENYLKNISDDFKKSWRGEIVQMMLQYEQQDESFCLGIYGNNKLLGLGQFFLEQSFQERKLMLSHFSTANPSKFQKYLKKILQFIWKIDFYQEIRTTLYHYDNNGSFQVNKDITAKLKELNFKWKIVQNVNSETRFTIMGIFQRFIIAIRRPQEFKISQQNAPIFLQNLFFTIGINNQIQNEYKFYSLSCLTNLNTLVYLKDNQINQVKDILIQSAYLFKGIELQEQARQLFHSYIYESFEYLNEINPYNNEIEQLPEQVISSFSKESYRWPKFKLSHNKLIYNCFRPEKNIDNAMVFMSESEEIKIYLIAVDQSNTTIFIFEYEGELSFERVQQILMQCGPSIPIDQNLNIPQFTLNCKFQVQDNVLGIGRFSTAYRPKMMDIENAQGLIIKTPFVFGIINEDFNELTNMPNLFFRVEEQHCLQF